MARVYTLIILVGFTCVAIKAGKGGRCIADNVAFSKPATVSSRYQANSYASLAVDEKLTQTYLNGGKPACFHTALSPNNWWQVDLRQIYNIERITLFNRQDCCAHRARKIEILIGETPNNLAKVAFVETVGSQKTIQIPKVKGRYVKLVQTVKEYFHLCEVQVFAEPYPCCYRPCQNGGRCKRDTSKANGYRCECPVSNKFVYSGDHCEKMWMP